MQQTVFLMVIKTVKILSNINSTTGGRDISDTQPLINIDEGFSGVEVNTGGSTNTTSGTEQGAGGQGDGSGPDKGAAQDLK